LLIVVGLAAAGCESAPKAMEPRPALRLLSGNPGGGGYAFGEALIMVMGRIRPDIAMAQAPTGSGLTTLQDIQAGRADLALAPADMAYLASTGALDSPLGEFDQLRAIGVLQLTPVQLIAAKGAAIRGIADLRGKRVGVGPEGSGTALTAQLLFKAFGVDEAAVVTEPLSVREAGRKLMRGDLDAMFNTTMYSEPVAHALKAGARVLPIEGAPLDRLRKEHPFLRAMLMPPRYPGVGHVPTLGVDILLICRATRGEPVVHDFTAALFQALEPLAEVGRWSLVGPDRAPATPIALHEGAARYYREQELAR
jgi:TRAP transporter TAXI family solute receptor